MDIQLVNKRYFNLYFCTLDIGVGVSYMPECKTLHIKLLVFEVVFYFGKGGKFA